MPEYKITVAMMVHALERVVDKKRLAPLLRELEDRAEKANG